VGSPSPSARPTQTVIAILKQLHIPFRNVRVCMSAPKMLERVWAIRLLKMCETEAPEDEPTLNVFQLFEDGM
jgi:hypothetical protein